MIIHLIVWLQVITNMNVAVQLLFSLNVIAWSCNVPKATEVPTHMARTWDSEEHHYITVKSSTEIYIPWTCASNDCTFHSV